MNLDKSIKTTLLKHARKVCDAVLGTEIYSLLSVHVYIAPLENFPFQMLPTFEYMVLIDFTNRLDLLTDAQGQFATFLSKEVLTHQEGESTWLFWGEGKKLSKDSIIQTNTRIHQLVALEPCDCISWLKTDTILPNWLDRLIYDTYGAIYQPNWKKFEINLDKKFDDLKIYLGSYFPRSYSEAFCIIEDIFSNETYGHTWSEKTEAWLLDIGTGTGGNLVGQLTAIAKYCPQLEVIHVVGYDGNQEAIEITNRIISSFCQHTQIEIDLTLLNNRFTTLSELPIPPYESFDFITSFKLGGEIISRGQGSSDNFYYDLLGRYIEYLSDHGMFILLDVTTKPAHTDFYPQLLNCQVSNYTHDYPDFSTVSPTPCYLYEINCKEKCFTQKEFSVSHSRAHQDLSRVSYRVISRTDFATELHQDSKHDAEYVICAKRENSELLYCKHSSGKRIKMDGYSVG